MSPNQMKDMPYWAERSGCFEATEVMDQNRIQQRITAQHRKPGKQHRPGSAPPSRTESRPEIRTGSPVRTARDADYVLADGVADAVFESLGSPNRSPNR